MPSASISSDSATTPSWYGELAPPHFVHRHLGVDADTCQGMLQTLGLESAQDLVDEIVPGHLKRRSKLDLPAPCTEEEALAELWEIADRNVRTRCWIGQGFYGSHLPPVLLRNLLENPGWYTQYTPYQAEISQGRLELLFAFQTLITELTGLPVANASLLDEASAVGEGVSLAFGQLRRRRRTVVADCALHPQSLAVLRTRTEALGITLLVQDAFSAELPQDDLCAVVVQTPDTFGRLRDGLAALADSAHAAGALVVAAVDPLAQCLLHTPASWGADIAVGVTQRFGLPVGFGGPHAGFIAVTDKLKRKLPGRIVGLSVDRNGKPAYRLALQTREQHIRRETATSNICTAQVLPALLATAYAAWHGPQGLRRIAQRVQSLTAWLQASLQKAGIAVETDAVFGTLTAEAPAGLFAAADSAGISVRSLAGSRVGLSLDETTTVADIHAILGLFGASASSQVPANLATPWLRTSELLPQEVFGSYHSEHEMLRFLTRLQHRDLSLAQSMIPLGSCTMKLNAAAEMIPLTWPSIGQMHPYVPATHARGYAEICTDLENWLSTITELPGCSLQPNAGSQGEYAGLIAIRAYLQAQGQAGRDVCLIPASAHGTNPASAVLAGFRVVTVACSDNGDIDLRDLHLKVAEHAETLGALMITYPSTHGVFEEAVAEVCAIVHQAGGQVYMDGANMNAQVGLTSPGAIGADVCHVNLHKTFCIPHGGGGPGMGPICVVEHLCPYLPTDPASAIDPPIAISATHYGSASILTISWMYVRMMGASGLTSATRVALLNANYMATRLADHFPVLYTGRNDRVAHEFILDLRPLLGESGLTVEDVAKRLMDYGFHAPTVSWPVAGTIMIEPTESESREELDRYCEALIEIASELDAIRSGAISAADSPLHYAPHTQADLLGSWDRAYTREQAAFPLPWVAGRKFWPFVARIDNAYGDRNLVCACS